MINLETLYPVVVGGGVTNLAKPYTPHVSTSITVVDSSQLNPAPNYLSLMTDDKTIVLTVKYQIKEGNTFKQLTIIEGTPGVETHVFGTDTEVLRPICKVDMDDIAENIRLLNVGKQDTIDSTHKLNADYVSDGTNNKVYTSAEKTKLSGVATGAQVNKIETIKANGAVLGITNKAVDIPIATGDNTAGLKRNKTSYISVYVSPTGSDTTGDGSQAKPWREIQTAVTRTANLGYEWVQIDCSAGTYDTPIEMEYNYPNYYILGRGNITTGHMNCKQSYGKVILRAYTGSINVVTDSNYGITLYNGCSLEKQGGGTLNVTSKQQGIRIDGADSDIVVKRWYESSLHLPGTTNITITNGSGNYGAISVFFPTVRLDIDTLNVDNPNGVGIRLSNEPHICTINKLNCNGTPYSLDFGSILFIEGKLVNQYESQRAVYVSPDGDDITGDGTEAKPWREIQTAIEKTEWYPVEVVSINVASGDYYRQVYTKSHRHIWRMVLQGDVTLHNNMIISSTSMTIDASTTGITFNIDTTEDNGLCLYYGATINQRISYLNIKCGTWGIYVDGASGAGTWKSGGIDNLALGAVTITLTKSNANGIYINFGTGYARVTTLTVNGTSGTALKLKSNIMFNCGTLTTNLTQYVLGGGTMLSIDGQWVNQTTEGE